MSMTDEQRADLAMRWRESRKLAVASKQPEVAAIIVEARKAADEACGTPTESAIGHLIDSVRALADALEEFIYMVEDET